MKRDMDIIRETLFQVEARPSAEGVDLVEIEGHEQEEISYHVKLLRDAGYLEAHDLRTMGPDGFKFAPSALTNAGHDFLDAARDDTVWGKAKAQLARIGGSAPLDVFRSVLTNVIRTTIDL